MAELIEFPAEIIKVQQLQIDFAIRVTLDLPETCIMQMAQLAECKRAGAVLQIRAEPYLTKLDDETEKNTKGSPAGVDSRRLDLRRNKQ